MRRYYVRYRAVIGQQGNIAEGGTEINRPDAICSMRDLNQIAADIASTVREHQHLPISCPVGVDVLSWQRFEDELIALPPLKETVAKTL